MSWIRKADDVSDTTEIEAMVARLTAVSARGRAEGLENPVADDPIVVQRVRKQFWTPSEVH